MRWAILTCLALAAVAGCGGSTAAGPVSDPEPDCAYPLVWEGVTYVPAADVEPSAVETSLGTAVVLGCGKGTGRIPDETVVVKSVHGIDPEVAVAASLQGNGPIAWLAPGYVTESPRHPLHLAVHGSADEPARPEYFKCGPAHVTPARALSTPRPLEPLRVQAENPEVESLLLEPGTQRLVSLDASTTLSGLERHGVPFVGFGDEFTLTLRLCIGDENEPGAAGLRLLMADRLSREG